jgi:hypothetical protein
MNENVTNLDSLIRRIKLEINFKWSDFEDALEHFFLNEINNNKDKVCFMIHLIMMQHNFCYYEANTERNTYQGINQVKSDLFNKITYNSIDLKTNCIILNSNLLITILKSGNNLDIHLKYKTFNSKFLTVKLHELFQPINVNSREKYLETFQIDFKDVILNPFKNYLRLNENIFMINGLIDLPFEILFKLCTNYLNVRSIVSLASSCIHFNKVLFSNLTKSETIWNKLIYRDFKIKLMLNDSSLLSTNYLEEYKKYYRKRKSNYNILII